MHTLRAFIITLLLAGTASTFAQQAADAYTVGEVRKVDRAAGKLTLQHEEIKNLDMPPMTMVFVVPDKAQLDPLKAGDKVRFKAVKQGGQYRVIEVLPAR